MSNNDEMTWDGLVAAQTERATYLQQLEELKLSGVDRDALATHNGVYAIVHAADTEIAHLRALLGSLAADTGNVEYFTRGKILKALIVPAEQRHAPGGGLESYRARIDHALTYHVGPHHTLMIADEADREVRRLRAAANRVPIAEINGMLVYLGGRRRGEVAHTPIPIGDCINEVRAWLVRVSDAGDEKAAVPEAEIRLLVAFAKRFSASRAVEFSDGLTHEPHIKRMAAADAIEAWLNEKGGVKEAKGETTD